MAEINVVNLPVISLSDFTDNDRFLIIDDGSLRQLSKATFYEWLSANVQGEKGEQGVAGRDGARGSNGRDGVDGSDGLSAYQIAVQSGFSGSLEDWLSSLKGEAAEKGEDGDDGWSPVVRVVTEGVKSALEIFDWVGGEGEKPTELGYLSENGVVSDFILATDVRGERGIQGEQGIQGEKGEKGDVGDDGIRGEQGLSAYEIAVMNGFEGTEEEWLLSLNPSEVSSAPNNIISKKVDGMFAEAPAYDPESMANAIDALEDKNIMTDAQKSKLEVLKTSKYLGTYLTSEEIPLEGAEAGNYADVDSGEPDVDTERWIYDADSLKFVKSVSIPASETSESVKEKYESNEDTNAFTDLEKAKLEGLEEETPETIKTKYESNPDTNALTDSLMSKLESLPTEGIQGESAFEIAVSEGFTGTQEEWLDSLKGEKGEKGDQGIAGTDGKDGVNATNETVKNQNTGLGTKIWIGTQQEYDDLVNKDSDTLYMVK